MTLGGITFPCELCFEHRRCDWEPYSVPCRQGIDIRVAARGPLVIFFAKIDQVDGANSEGAYAPLTEKWVQHDQIPCQVAGRLPPVNPTSFATQINDTRRLRACSSLCAIP